jgi:spermidine/putrescine transport system substrate-binding protein
MKKLLFLLVPAIILSCVVLINGTNSALYLLNWGEYIDPSLITLFEEQYNTKVIMEEVGSSEDMYQKIKSGITSYDVAIPGDYMIERMYSENMLNEIDLTQLDNYSDDMFVDDLTNLRKTDFFTDNEKYCVPYFWGAYGLLYSKKKDFVEETIKTQQWNAILKRDSYGENANNVNLAMYSVPRFGTTAYLLNNDKDINTNKVADFDGLVSTMRATNYDLWGDDTIKKQIAVGNIDVGLTQLGDFFDQYYLSSQSGDVVDFSYFIPDKTSAFFDAMVIPKTSKNTDLANSFINFMIDTDNSFQNATYVGYCPTLKSVCSKLSTDSDYTELLANYPFYIDPLNGKNAKLFRNIDKMDDGENYQDFLQGLVNQVKA